MVRKFLLAIGFVVATARCGVPVCAAGFGDCEEMWKNAPASTTNGGGSVSTGAVMSLNSQKKNVAINEATELTPSGGTPAYRYRVDPSDNHGQVIQSAGKVYFRSDAANTYRIYVNDSAVPSAQGFTDVVVQ